MALPALLFALFAGQEAVSTAAPEPAPAAAAQAEYTPEGAPRDDYNFVAWCHGVLSGHMALAEHIQPVLPMDEVQQKIGKSYLKGYEEALAAGRSTRSAAELDAADAIRAAARANWNTAMKADLQLGADTYLAWQLPGRCEHAAKRVAGRADLFRMIPVPQDGEAVGTGAPVADASDVPPARAVAPAPAAAPAPAPDSTAPVFTSAAPVPESAVPVFTTADVAPDLPAETAPAEAAMVETAAPAPAEVPASAVFTTAVTDEPAEAPAETAAAADPAPEAPAAEEAPKPADGDRRIVRMPSKGRLFPWGKRE